MRRRDRKDPYNLRKTRLSEGDFRRVSGRSRTHYAPSEVFVDQVRSSREFVPLYKGDKYHSWCPPTTEFYRYEDEATGAGSIVQIPCDTGIDCSSMGKIQTLWVPDEWSGRGIARRCMESLQDLAMDTIDIVNEHKYKGMNLTNSVFSLILCPNPFDVSDCGWCLYPEDCPNVYWESPSQASEGIIDESHHELPVDKRRLSWTDLRDFYIRLGFVDVPELDGRAVADEYWNKIIIKNTLQRRSMEIGRHMMIWPAENRKYYQNSEYKWTE